MGDVQDKANQSAQAARLERLQSPDRIQSAKASRYSTTTVVTADLWLVQVVDSTEAAGIYDCNPQTTFGTFAGPSIEVFHLGESYTVNTPSPALAAGDILAACQMTDSEANTRWVGKLVSSSVRRAVVKADAGANQYLSCNLIDKDGTEITSGLGAGVDVYFNANKIVALPDWELDATSPRLQIGDIIPVENLGGKWYCADLFAQTENHECGV